MTAVIHPTRVRKTGHTLLEMMLSLVLLSLVMTSVGSAVMFASQAIPAADSPVATLIDDSVALSRLAEDLAMAKYVTERGDNAVTVIVTDRTGDGLPDRIRYAWSGTAGDPLTVQLNGEPKSELVEAVDEFNCDYTLTPAVTQVPGAQTLGPERMVASFEIMTGATWSYVTTWEWFGQLISPAHDAESAGFVATRAELYAGADGSTNGVLALDLIRYEAGTLHFSDSYATGTLKEVDPPYEGGWHSVSLAPTSAVPLDQSVALILKYQSGSGTIMRLAANNSAQGGQLLTTNVGVNWSVDNARAMNYRLYGRDVLTSPDFEVTRRHITAIDVSLKSTAQGRSPVTRTINMQQTPEVLANLWEADFNASPTELDLNSDGAEDWAYNGGGAIPAEDLAAGVWSARDALSARPTTSLPRVVRVEARVRAQSGHIATICGPFHTDDSGNVLPLYTVIQEDGSGGQKLLFYNEQSPTTPFATISGIDSDWIDLQLTLLPDEQVLSVRVNGEERGTALLSWEADQGPRGFWVVGSGSGAQFSRVRYTFGGSYAESDTDLPDIPLGDEDAGGDDGDGGILGGLLDLLF